MTTEPVSIPSPNPILDLADALNSLGRHAASMESGDGHVRDDCIYCSTTLLLSRVVHFGDQLRAERRAGRS